VTEVLTLLGTALLFLLCALLGSLWRFNYPPFVVNTQRLGTIRCAVVYQGVATRNDATTQEMLAHRTMAQANFVMTEFSEV
jgi:hypothetical protein